MKFKRVLYGLIVITMIVLIALYAGFFMANDEEKTSEEERAVLRVLAPYQARMQQQILDTIAAEYSRDKDHPVVEMIYVPKENLEKELSLRRMTGENQVDVLICENTLVPGLIKKQTLREVPVSKKMNEGIKDNRLWNHVQHDARYYGYPLTCDPYVLYYNADVLEEKQVEIPNSWKELIQDGYKVKKSGMQSIGIAAKREDEVTNLFWIMLCSKGSNLNSMNGEIWEECFQNFKQLAISGLTSPYAVNFTQEDLALEFAQGRVMMMVNQMSAVSVLKSRQTEFSVGMTKVPQDEAGGTFWFGDVVCITKEAGNGAFAFARYLTDKETSERINDAMGTLQVYTGVSYKEKGKIYMEDVEEMKDLARPMLSYCGWTDICSAISRGVSETLNNTLADVEQISEDTRDQVRVAILSDS